MFLLYWMIFSYSTLFSYSTFLYPAPRYRASKLAQRERTIFYSLILLIDGISGNGGLCGSDVEGCWGYLDVLGE